MSTKTEIKVYNPFGFIYTILSTITAIIGYNIHHSIAWSIVDFIFYPIVWVKWLIFQEVNLTIIKQSFDFFFK